MSILNWFSQIPLNSQNGYGEEMGPMYANQCRTIDCGRVLKIASDQMPEQGEKMLSLLSNSTYFPAENCVPYIALDLVHKWVRALPNQAHAIMEHVYDMHLFPDIQQRNQAVVTIIKEWMIHNPPIIRACAEETNICPLQSWNYTQILEDLQEKEQGLPEAFHPSVSLCLSGIALHEGVECFKKVVSGLTTIETPNTQVLNSVLTDLIEAQL